MYVCVYVCMCVCMYVCTYVCNVCMYISTYMCMYICMYIYVCIFFYVQHVPLQIAILHAWKDHRTRFTLYTFPYYFRLIPMAVCVLFVFLDL